MAGASAFIYFVIRTFRPPLTQCTVLDLIRLFYAANTYFNHCHCAWATYTKISICYFLSSTVLLNYKAVRKKMFQLRQSFHLDCWDWETPRHLGVIRRSSPAQSFFFLRALENSLSINLGRFQTIPESVCRRYENHTG